MASHGEDEERPSDETLAEESTHMPAGWEVKWSERFSRRYYHRLPTAHTPYKTQWDMPSAAASSSSSSSSSSPRLSSAHAAHPSNSSPRGPSAAAASSSSSSSSSSSPHGTKRGRDDSKSSSSSSSSTPFDAVKRAKVQGPFANEKERHQRRYDEVMSLSQHIFKTHVIDQHRPAVAAGERPWHIANIPWLEEPAEVHLERKIAFDKVEAYLRDLCLKAGLRAEPSMAFQRWGFVQRLTQPGPGCGPQEDPVLPLSPTTDSGLLHELVRERKPLSYAAALDVCTSLAHMTAIEARRLLDFRSRVMMLGDGKVPRGITDAEVMGRIVPAPRDADEVHVYVGAKHYFIRRTHHDKLLALYEKHTQVMGDDASRGRFARRLWCLLSRYDTIGGAGYQAALPEECFEQLGRDFGVAHECYASPLNQFLPSYGSAFPDTDRWFGSQGSFFDMRRIEGGFESNPPFLEEVMGPNALHVVHLMEQAEAAGTALCFVVIWPGWDDTPSFDILDKSKYKVRLLVYGKNQHSYKDGFQHRTGVYRVSGAKSNVFIMQSPAARLKWPCTDEKIKIFNDLFAKRRS